MTTGPTIGVLALQGDVREHRAMLEQAGAGATIAVRRPAELAQVDGIVLPGGESTTMSKLARTFDLLDPLRQAVADGLPAFGTCAGMILLAGVVLDGRPDQLSFAAIDIAVRRNGYGRQLDSFEADLDAPALGDEPLHGVFIRAPMVTGVGPGAEVLARDPDGTPVTVRQGRVLATAFHPELTGDRRIHRLLASLIAERAAHSP